MNTYKDSDFEDLLFPFHKVKKNLTRVFPKLADLYEGIEIVSDDIILYVGFAYDKGSPLQKLESIVDRKVQAALMAGFEADKDGKFRPEIEAVFKCENTEVNDMIVRYCRLLSSRLYSVLVAGNETLHTTIKQLMDFVPQGDGEDLLKQHEMKLKLLDKAKESANDMDELSQVFLRDDNKNLNDYVYMVSNNLEKYINLTPEDFSKLEHHPPVLKSQP